MMAIDMSNWGEFRIGDLFSQIYNTTANTKSDVVIYPIQKANTIPFVSRTESNNGCNGYVSINDVKGIENGNAIIIGDTTATVFYYGQNFVCGDHIIVLRADWLNTLTGLFIVSILKKDKYRYSYGRAFQKDIIINTRVLLPQTQDGQPDWTYIEQFMESLNWANIETKNKKTNIQLGVNNWKEFKLCDICNIYMGNKLDFDKMNFDNPSINFIGRTAINNGVRGKVDRINDLEPYHKGCITIALGGSLGETFIQQSEFYTSQNVAVIEFPTGVSNCAKLFIATLIKNESKYKYYPFGRELNSHIKTDFSIELPVTQDGQPDWEFMEQYIKHLPYGDLLN